MQLFLSKLEPRQYFDCDGPIQEQNEEVYEVFGYGADNEQIAALDTSGVALASIQELTKQLHNKNRQLENLQASNDYLFKKIVQLEKIINNL